MSVGAITYLGGGWRRTAWASVSRVPSICFAPSPVKVVKTGGVMRYSSRAGRTNGAWNGAWN
jgi:hypothetical protein